MLQIGFSALGQSNVDQHGSNYLHINRWGTKTGGIVAIVKSLDIEKIIRENTILSFTEKRNNIILYLLHLMRLKRRELIEELYNFGFAVMAYWGISIMEAKNSDKFK